MLYATRLIFQEYAASLTVAECLTDFEEELNALPGDYAAPRGQLLVAMVGDEVLACCALRPLDNVDYSNACEIRRLYVRHSQRGLGLGRRLTEAQMDFARMQGYSCMLLDTLSDMEAARALYEDLGFEEIPPYYFNPIAGATT
jgi:ribosomal protein S18 acetylase RimI-like enzyme